MKPEQFIREMLRKTYGDNVAKEFDRALAEGLPCELCGCVGRDVTLRKLEGGKARYMTLYNATRQAIPGTGTVTPTEIIPLGDKALCGMCAKLVDNSGPTGGEAS